MRKIMIKQLAAKDIKSYLMAEPNSVLLWLLIVFREMGQWLCIARWIEKLSDVKKLPGNERIGTRSDSS